MSDTGKTCYLSREAQEKLMALTLLSAFVINSSHKYRRYKFIMKDSVKRDLFDFEVGYLTESPCLRCNNKKNIPKCFKACTFLDNIRELLARGISTTQASSFIR